MTLHASWARRPVRAVAATPLLLALGLAACAGGDAGPVPVASVEVSPTSVTLLVGPGGGQSRQLTATPRAGGGGALTDRPVTWSAPAGVVSVSATGLVTAAAPGTAAVVASVEGRTASVAVTVQPVPVAAVRIAPSTLALAVGRSQQLEAQLTDSTGSLLGDRTVAWRSASAAVATVSATGLVLAVAPGSTTLTAESEGRSASVTVTVTLAPPPPVIASVTPTLLTPGSIATVNGSNFDPVAARNAVTIGGVAASVLTATPTQLTVAVPCAVGGTVPLGVGVAGSTTATTTVTLDVPVRTLTVGAPLYLGGTGIACNTVAAPGGSARIVALVHSAATSPNTLVDLELGGNPSTTAVALRVTPPAVRLAPPSREEAAEAAREREHAAFMERQAAFALANRAAAARTPRFPVMAQVAPPAVGTIRSLYFNFNSCSDSTQVIRARLVYAGTRALVWEDSANALQADVVPALAAYYRKLAAVFEADQYRVVRDAFGDPLRRDPLTDADGRLSMVFTQRINGTSAAAYVTSCDMFPRNTSSRAASNNGEYFYGNVPTTAALNVASTAAPDGWYAFMSRTVVHEVKHIASLSARIANNAPAFEEGWLEEGTARHAEEVWARQAVHRVAFRGNTGWGSATTPGVFCDFNLADATCLAADTLRRPTWGMRRQLNEIRNKLLEPWNWSPYGDATGQAGSVFYNSVWSLVRFAIDRYGVSDEAFLTALTQSTATGLANLSAVTGQSADQLLAAWGLALYLDDYPGLGNASADLRFQTWNLRSIYAGLNADPAWRGTWTIPYPVVPVPLPFGSFTTQRTGLRGGAHAYFELSGDLSRPQLLSLRAPGGGAPSPFLRLTLVRIQ